MSPTPLRAIRVPDEVWHACQARAKAEGTTVSAVILRALHRYAKGAPRQEPPPAIAGKEG